MTHLSTFVRAELTLSSCTQHLAFWKVTESEACYLHASNRYSYCANRSCQWYGFDLLKIDQLWLAEMFIIISTTSLESPAAFHVLAGPGVGFMLDAPDMAEFIGLLRSPYIGGDDMQFFKCSLSSIYPIVIVFKAIKLLYCEHIDLSDLIDYQVPSKPTL